MYSVWCLHSSGMSPNTKTHFSANWLLKKCAYNFDGLVQDWRISIANALEILQSRTKQSTWFLLYCSCRLMLSEVYPKKYAYSLNFLGVLSMFDTSQFYSYPSELLHLHQVNLMIPLYQWSSPYIDGWLKSPESFKKDNITTTKWNTTKVYA